MPQMADMTSAARSPLQKLRQVPLGSGRARPLDGDRHGQLADGGAVLGTQVAACPVDVGYQIELLGDPNQGADIPNCARTHRSRDRKSTRLNSSHVAISYAVFCL